MDFGIELAAQRRARGLSQAALAGVAGVSQRHLSFLETGRARPGAGTIARLIEGLRLGAPDAARLLARAGLGAAPRVLDWGDPQLAEARRVVALVLARHDPWPALACDRAGDVLDANAGFARLLALAGAGDLWAATCGAGPRNIYDLTLDPRGPIQWCENAAEVVPHVLRRLRHAAAVCPRAAATLARVARHPAVRAARAVPPRPATGVVAESYRIGALSLRLISTTSCFGSPEDDTSASLQIETFFPADPATAALFE